MELHQISEYMQFSEERFTKVDFVKNRRSNGFVLNFLPGQEMKAHHHPGKDLFLYMVDGTGTVTVDDEPIALKTGDVLYCEAEEKIGFINTSDANVSIYGAMTKTVDK